MSRDEIANQALTLPPEDRAHIADVLRQSLNPTPFATPEIAQAWSKEIDRRIAAYDRGETKALDFETAKRHLHEALEEQRRTQKTS